MSHPSLTLLNPEGGNILRNVGFQENESDVPINVFYSEFLSLGWAFHNFLLKFYQSVPKKKKKKNTFLILYKKKSFK